MKQNLCETDTLLLSFSDTARWGIFYFEEKGRPSQDDVAAALETLSDKAEEESRPLCVALDGLSQPNSRILAALIGLLTKKDGTERRVALACTRQVWLDMLDILGVSSRFVLVDSPGELTV